MHFDLELRRRHVALFLGSIAALVAIAATPQLLGDRVADAVDGLAAAEMGWLWLAALAFGASLVASACGWASALTRCGGATTRPDAAARYCTGSLVNALAPARIGTAVRFALFARTLPERGTPLDGRRRRDLSRRRAGALARRRARARIGQRRAAAVADRSPAPARTRRGGGGVARAGLAARQQARARARRLPRARPVPAGGGSDRGLGRACRWRCGSVQRPGSRRRSGSRIRSRRRCSSFPRSTWPGCCR